MIWKMPKEMFEYQAQFIFDENIQLTLNNFLNCNVNNDNNDNFQDDIEEKCDELAEANQEQY